MGEFENIILVNRYELIEEIGSGGMAYVYKAMDTRLSRYVAVKILKKEFTNNKDFVQSFSYEAMSAASITHPNIVSIYDAGYDKGLFFIVMELIEGITLKDLIDKKKYIKWKDALVVTKQILSALEVAHKNNIVHRDIKPHNIMLTYDGVAKVADFGIARAVSGNTREISDLNAGSVHYISPEQAKGEVFDERSDLYAIGITLFEMLTGNVPFDGETAIEVAMKNIQQPIVPPHEVNEAIPVGVSDFVVKATMKEPAERYQSAIEMLSSLQVVMLVPNEPLTNTSNYLESRGGNLGRNSDKNSVKARTGSGKYESLFDRIFSKKIKGPVVIVTALLLAIFVFSVSFNGISEFMKEFRAKEYRVIDFTNQNYDEVYSQLRSLGINVKSNYEVSSSYEKGVIMGQNHDVDSILRPQINSNSSSSNENTIVFLVSYGSENFEIKDYGKLVTDYRIVENDFKNTGVRIEYVYMYNSNVSKDYVISTRPGVGEVLNSGDYLYVFRSLGSAPQVMTAENYVGVNEFEAIQRIEAAGLKYEIKYWEEPVKTETEEGQNNDSSLGTSDGDITSSPAPTIKPAPVVRKVMAQYPLKGMEISKDETIVLYLSSPEKFRTFRKLSIYEEDSMNLTTSFSLKIVATPCDTGVKETLEDIAWEKGRMPFVLDVGIPYRGETVVEVFINNEFFCKYTLGAP